MRRDHPRSRGVYLWYYATDENGVGSSPLARGLPLLGPPAVIVGRIIPARAGFTTRGGVKAAPKPDHPRSRGVYGDGGAGGRNPGGSSPLARGLHGRREGGEAGCGIIPARAGFTRHDRGRCGRGPDHPRSRGVYGAKSGVALEVRGSSPLARGLPGHPHLRRPGTRIIPARAGFTRSQPPTWSSTRDHPRSRGVYAPRAALLWRSLGSSPLARGLHDEEFDMEPLTGIIPARAGFTRLRMS